MKKVNGGKIWKMSFEKCSKERTEHLHCCLVNNTSLADQSLRHEEMCVNKTECLHHQVKYWNLPVNAPLLRNSTATSHCSVGPDDTSKYANNLSVTLARSKSTACLSTMSNPVSYALALTTAPFCLSPTFDTWKVIAARVSRTQRSNHAHLTQQC